MTRQPLVTRYTILKGKLQKEIGILNEKHLEVKCLVGILTEHWPISQEELLELLQRQIRLHRQSLRLLEDTYNGEDIDIT